MFEESIWWASMNSWLTPTVLFVILNLVIGTIAISSTLAKSQNIHQKKISDQLDRSPSVLQKLKSVNIYNFRSQEAAASYLLQTNPEPEQEQTSLFRSPSVLHRLKSIGRYSSAASPPEHTEPEPEKEQSDFFRSPSVLQRLKSIGRYNSAARSPEMNSDADKEADELRSIDEIYIQLKSGGGGHVTRSNSDTVPNAGAISKPVKLAKKMKKSASAKSAFAHFEEVETIEARRPATVREIRVPAKDDDDDEEVDSKADDFINKFKQTLKLQRLNSIIRYKEMIGGK